LEKEILEKAHFSNEPMWVMLSMAVLHFSRQKKKKLWFSIYPESCSPNIHHKFLFSFRCCG